MKNEIAVLLQKGLISEEKAKVLKSHDAEAPFSVFWELRLLLYVGIAFFTTGIGILIYQHIEGIGHSILIGGLSLACVFCLVYAFKHRKAFTWVEVENEKFLVDYALLGGCMLFLIIEGYLQYQYSIFGKDFKSAALLPAALFLFLAYFLDHRGVLSMGVSAAASYFGISFSVNKFNETYDTDSLIFVGMVFGVFLMIIGWFSEKFSLKKHFAFTYYLFGGNLAFISVLAAFFTFENNHLYAAILVVLSLISILHARVSQSYLLFLMGLIYGYVGVTVYVFTVLGSDAGAFVSIFYFLFSCGGVVYFLFNIKKMLKFNPEKSI